MLLLLSDLYEHSNINNIENYLFEADLYQNKFWKVRLWCLGSREGQGWRENIPKITPGWMLALKFLSSPNYDEKIDIPRVPSSLARSLCRLSPT